ncbi:DNA repair protein RecO [Pediococcus pentosaceus]|uniref:DNA repair protein RecO n=1 Tax=Pediococcus pentosaceus TaxID=1255 RepID=UPI001008DFF5|nr:DNA repair protein RecO [Pediococcus pentosaceus]RXI22203.1 DNA repair protein RecO [Pediococcus pentosaceus]
MNTVANADFNGIVMFERSHRENDLLVKFLTKEHGKRMFFIRNAKKVDFKLRSAILPFSHGQYTGLIRSNGLSYINAALDVQQFENIFQDITLNAYATFVLNLVDAAFDDNVKITSWFERINRALILIDAGNDAEIITDLIQIQLLNSFGISITWDHCVICGRTDFPLDYSEAFGGMLCQSHWERDEHRWHLKPKSARIIGILSAVSIFKLGQISISKETKQEIWNLTADIYKNQVGINLKSRSFIDQMKKWEI